MLEPLAAVSGVISAPACAALVNEPVPRIVFPCVHNAGRSQIAAGRAWHLGGDAIEVFSGGSDPAAGVNAAAVEVMADAGVDIAAQTPQRRTDEIVRSADVVVTRGCGDERPFFPGVQYEDWPLDDPAGLDTAAVRFIRDEIRRRVEDLLGRLGTASTQLNRNSSG